LKDAVQKVADEWGLAFDSAQVAPSVAKHEAKTPRLGVWVPWADTDSIGWIRTFWINEKCRTFTCAMRIFAQAGCETR